MTTTGPAEVVMSACAHAAASRPVLARPSFRELVSLWPASGEPTSVRAVFPGSASFKPAFDRAPDRSHGLQPGRPMPPRRPATAPGPPRPPCPRSSWIAHPLYLYLPEWPGAALPGSSSDPGRDMLCIHTSPPRWLQWP
jgi:hypothetical protein